MRRGNGNLSYLLRLRIRVLGCRETVVLKHAQGSACYSTSGYGTKTQNNEELTNIDTGHRDVSRRNTSTAWKSISIVLILRIVPQYGPNPCRRGQAWMRLTFPSCSASVNLKEPCWHFHGETEMWEAAELLSSFFESTSGTTTTWLVRTSQRDIEHLEIILLLDGRISENTQAR